MTHDDHTATRPPTADERDLLVSRVVDGEADPADWARLREIAGTDGSVWAQIAETQADHESLRDAVVAAIDEAGDIELPDAISVHGDHGGVQRRIDAVRSWGGWAAAAAILLVWATGIPGLQSGNGNASGTNVAGIAGPKTIPASFTPEELRDQYVQRGQQQGLVVGELPEPVVIEARALPDGSGVEVFTMRQIIERQIVKDIYRSTRDEAGNVAPVAIRVTEPLIHRQH